jgi:hypothetical protein
MMHVVYLLEESVRSHSQNYPDNDKLMLMVLIMLIAPINPSA